MSKSKIDEKALFNLYQALQNPTKRAAIINGLNNSFSESSNQTITSPNGTHYLQSNFGDSPTVIQRKRALERMGVSNEENNTSILEEIQTNDSLHPKVPCSMILIGVTAFVEYKDDCENHANNIKDMLLHMGAVVSEELNKNVTHVIFKNGSFSTYSKAKLLEIPVISIFWLEASRKNNARVPEEKYSALSEQFFEENVLVASNKIIKNFEEVIKKQRTSFSPVLESKPNKLKRKSMDSITPKEQIKSVFLANLFARKAQITDIPNSKSTGAHQSPIVSGCTDSRKNLFNVTNRSINSMTKKRRSSPSTFASEPSLRNKIRKTDSHRRHSSVVSNKINEHTPIAGKLVKSRRKLFNPEECAHILF